MAAKKKAPAKASAKKETKGSAIKAIVNALKGKKAKAAPAPSKAASAKKAAPVPAKATAKKAAPAAKATKETAKKATPAKEAPKKKLTAAELKAQAAAEKAAKKAASKAATATAAHEEEAPAAKPERKLTARQMAKAAAAAAAQAAIDAACREIACESASLIQGYCRLHYIKNWKKIKRKEIILREKKLNQYIEELVAKYPDKYIEAIRNDLSNEKDFAKVISDLDIDEGTDEFEGDTENVEAIVDSIRRDFEDDGDF